MTTIHVPLPVNLPDGKLWILVEPPFPNQGTVEVELRDSVGTWRERVRARVDGTL